MLVSEVEWLMTTGRDAEAVTTRLIECLGDRDASTREKAASVLSSVNVAADRVIPAAKGHPRRFPRGRPRRVQSLASIYQQRSEGDDGLRLVAGLDSLERLDLSFTKVSDQGLAYLSGMRNLRDLTLSNTITDAVLARLPGIASLRELHFNDWRLPTRRPNRRLATRACGTWRA